MRSTREVSDSHNGLSGARVAQDSREAKGQAEGEARSVEQRTWFHRVAQVGLSSRGVVYLILAGLAFEIAASGSSSAQANSQGALQEVARQPTGPFLLALLAVGFVAYAAWRAVQVVAGKPGKDHSEVWTRIGWAASGILYLILCAEACQLIAGSSSSSASSHPQPFVANVLKWPAGPELVGLVAVAIAGGGIALAVWGIFHDYRKVLDEHRLGRAFPAARVAGAVGDTVRGLLVVLVAVYLFSAAVTDQPSQAKGLDTALQSLVHEPGGPVLLGLAGTGMVAFAGYSFIEALGRRMSS
ncbi:MAG: putative integral rane protein [Acidimicrobiaceae bacterium]|nr:putative integral rane protein [Acidimicrobiaceae bacterium]